MKARLTLREGVFREFCPKKYPRPHIKLSDLNTGRFPVFPSSFPSHWINSRCNTVHITKSISYVAKCYKKNRCGFETVPVTYRTALWTVQCWVKLFLEPFWTSAVRPYSLSFTLLHKKSYLHNEPAGEYRGFSQQLFPRWFPRIKLPDVNNGRFLVFPSYFPPHWINSRCTYNKIDKVCC